MFGERSSTAEKDVASQPVALHAPAFLQKDRPVRYGTGFVAATFTNGEPGFYRIYATEANCKKYEGGQHSNTETFQQAEKDNDDEDDQDNAEFRPRQAFVASYKSFIQHAETGKHQNSADEHRRNELQHPVTDQQCHSDHDRCDHTGQPGGGSEELAAHGGRYYQGSHRSTTHAGNHACKTGRFELAIPVQLLIHCQFKSGDVHDDADESDQYQRQHMKSLTSYRCPFYVCKIGGE